MLLKHTNKPNISNNGLYLCSCSTPPTLFFIQKMSYLMNYQCWGSGDEREIVEDRVSLEFESPIWQKCCWYWEFKMETLVLFGFKTGHSPILSIAAVMLRFT